MKDREDVSEIYIQKNNLKDQFVIIFLNLNLNNRKFSTYFMKYKDE